MGGGVTGNGFGLRRCCPLRLVSVDRLNTTTEGEDDGEAARATGRRAHGALRVNVRMPGSRRERSGAWRESKSRVRRAAESLAALLLGDGSPEADAEVGRPCPHEPPSDLIRGGASVSRARARAGPMRRENRRPPWPSTTTETLGCSSVGQSDGLQNRESQVQLLPPQQCPAWRRQTFGPRAAQPQVEPPPAGT